MLFKFVSIYIYIYIFFFFLRKQLSMYRIKELINQQKQQVLSLVKHTLSRLATEKKVSFSRLRNVQQNYLVLQYEREKL